MTTESDNSKNRQGSSSSRSDLLEGLLLFAIFVVFMTLWMLYVDIP